MERGYVRSYRKKIYSDLWRNKNAFRVFEFLLHSATYRPHKYFTGGICIDLQPGDYVSSVRTIADHCFISVRESRSSISYLKSTQRIAQRTTHLYSIFSIINWNTYQNPDNSNDTAIDTVTDTQTTQQRHSSDTVTTQEQEVKHLRKVKRKKEPTSFVPPSVEDVTAYCLERGNKIDPKYFVDSNTAKGWVIGRTQTPAKDWKAMIRTWEGNEKGGSNGSGAKGQHGQRPADGGPKAEPGKYDAIPKIISEAKR